MLGSALVDGDTVYFGDVGGWFCALDRATGAERWRINARGKEFPGSHPINVFMASPIMADGKIIAAGGTLEQLVAATPFYRGSTGRGFVVALEPKTGRIVWKYDLGEKPEPLDPPITITDSWGPHKFYFGPGTSSIWSTPSFDAETGTIFFGTDVNTAPAPDLRRSAVVNGCLVRNCRGRREERQRALGDPDQPGRRLDQFDAVLRPEGRSLQGSVHR